MRLKGPYRIEHIHQPYQDQATFYMEIPFSHLKDARISVANRTLVNKCSGRLRHRHELKGHREIDGKIITDPEEMYVFHWSYNRHFQELKLIDAAGIPTELAVVNGNRDLGNNAWHIAWETRPPDQVVLGKGGKIAGREPQDRLVRLADEPYTKRTYNCLIVPHDGHPYIADVCFSEDQEVLNPQTGNSISGQIKWLTYGKPMVKDGDVVDVSDPKIIEQFGGDIRHILKLSDNEATIFEGELKGIASNFSEKGSSVKEAEILNMLYDNYPADFAEKVLKVLDDIPKAQYYFNVVGTTEKSLVICHRQGTLEEVGNYLIKEHNVKEAIILDEGGSVACWASWHGPTGGFLNISNYFRPLSISCISFVLT